MMRYGNCGYGSSSAQYRRQGNKYGVGYSGCGCMSDTEYDNETDDTGDENDAYIIQPPRFRNQPVPDHRFPPHGRHSSVSGPPSRQITQPVQASLKFNNDSFDGDSICSGTFTIDLSTLQKIQSRQQNTRNVSQNQPKQFSGPRRSRPYTSMSVTDPEPMIPYRQEPDYGPPYSHDPGNYPPHSGYAHRRYTNDYDHHQPPPQTTHYSSGRRSEILSFITLLYI